MLGACTGAITMIAAAYTTSVSELLDVSPELISIALRMGLEVFRRSEGIESSEGSWSVMILDKSVCSVQTLLEQFNEEQVRDSQHVASAMAD